MGENEQKQRMSHHIVARKATESARLSRKERDTFHLEQPDPETAAWLMYKKIEPRLRNVNRMLSNS